jgi:glycosyltransferase involved in cell wall biosynthesis
LEIGYEDNNGGSLFDKLVHYPRKQRRHKTALALKLAEIRPDITVSMFCNEVNLLPKIHDGSRKVLEIHFSRFKRLQYGRKGLWGLVDRLRSRNDAKLAARYDRFVVLTQEDKSYWPDLPNLRVIPNAKPFSLSEPASLQSHTVLAVGRYTYQKGFDLLLKAWRMIDTKGWTLRIAGSGDTLDDVPDNVVTGLSTDIVDEYRNAAFLVMSSRFEGLPMALLEAQAAGLPIVSFACKCGPKDVITEGEDGILVPEGDIGGLSNGMKRLMEDESLRLSMGQAAFRNSVRFDKEKIMSQWENLFRELS